MTDAEHKVVYRAVADVAEAIVAFRALRKEINQASKDQKDIADQANKSNSEAAASIKRRGSAERKEATTTGNHVLTIEKNIETFRNQQRKRNTTESIREIERVGAANVEIESRTFSGRVKNEKEIARIREQWMLGAQRLNSKHVRESIALENVARKKADGERDVLLKRGASGIHKYNLQLAKDLANAESGDIKRREQLLRNAESGIHKFRLQIANDIAKAEQDAAGKRNELLRNAESGIYKFRLAMTAETEKQMLGAINSERKAYESYQQGAIRADREMHRERLSMIEDEFKARIRMQNELERATIRQQSKILRWRYDNQFDGYSAADSKAKRDFDRESRDNERRAKISAREYEVELRRLGKRGFGEMMKDASKAWATVERGSGILSRLSASIRSMDRKRSSDGGGGGIFDGLIGGLNAFGEASAKVFKHISFWPMIWGLIATAIGPVITILGALSSVILAVSNTAMYLGGAIAALPGLFAAAATGVGALLVALQPLGDVFKAYTAQQKAMSEGSNTSSAAYRQAADRIRSAAKNVAQAERGIADAQYDAQQAVKRLIEARKQELRNLQDLRSEVARSSLTEERAVLALEQAHDSYNKTIADPSASLTDRKDALISLKEAEWDLYDVRLRNQRNSEDLNKAEKKGVEGSDAVIDAKRGIQQANQRVADSMASLVDAQRELAESQQEMAAGGSAAYKAQEQLKAALDQLSPSARAVVSAVIDSAGAFKDLQRDVQEAMFAPLVDQIGNLKQGLPVVKKLLTDSASAVGEVAKRGIELATSGPWTEDFKKLSEANAENIKAGGSAALYFADGLRNITMAAIPFTKWVVKGIESLAKSFADWSNRARNDGSIEAFLGKTAERMRSVWNITKNLAGMLLSWTKASTEFTDWMLERAEAVTGAWRKTAKTQEQSGSKLKKWLEDVKPLLSEIAKFIGAVAGGLAGMASDTGNIGVATKLLRDLREEIGGPLRRVIDEIGEQGVLSEIAVALGDILEALANFLEAGGGRLFTTFIKTLTTLIEILTDIASLPGVAQVLGGVAAALGVLAAATVVGKFTGFFKLLEGLRWLVVNKGNIRGALTAAAGFGGTAATGAGGVGAAGAAGAASTKAGGATMVGAAEALTLAARQLQAAAVALGRAAGVDVAGSAGMAAAGAGAGAKSTGKAGRFRGMMGGRLGLLTALGGMGLLATGQADDFGSYGGGLMTGAAYGSLLGPWGALIGAGIGGTIGNAAELNREKNKTAFDYSRYIPAVNLTDKATKKLLGDDNDTEKNIDVARRKFSEALADMRRSFAKEMITPVNEFIGSIPEFFNNTIPLWFASVGVRFQEGVVIPVIEMISRLPESVTNVIISVFSMITEYWNGNVTQSILSFIMDLPSRFEGVIVSFLSGISQYFNGNVAQSILNFIIDLPSRFEGVITGFLSRITQYFNGNIAQSIIKFIMDIPSLIANAFESGMRSATQFISNAGKDVRNFFSEGSQRAGGGFIYGPPGTDNIAIRGTAGEYVVKNVFAQRGMMPDILEAINSGRITDVDLMPSLARINAPYEAKFSVPQARQGESSSNTTNKEININIHNPAPEPASDSLSRRAHALMW
jgi:hypothetical protein